MAYAHLLEDPDRGAGSGAEDHMPLTLCDGLRGLAHGINRLELLLGQLVGPDAEALVNAQLETQYAESAGGAPPAAASGPCCSCHL